MPILKHAKKKLKQDKKRTIKNKKIKDTYKSQVKKAKEKTTNETVSKAFSAIDKAAKKFILSKNKASRMKASLAKQIASGKTTAVDAAKPKAASKKAAAKSKKPVAKASKTTGAKKTKPSSKKK
jgi:ribosomal protein S20